MDISGLLSSAKKLPKVSDGSIEQYESKRGLLVSEVNTLMLEREDINELVGKANIEMMKDNHNNHSLFVISILKVPVPELLVDTVIWVFKAYRSRGFHPNYWASQLNDWLTAMEKNLSESAYNEIFPLYNWFIVNIPVFTALSEDTASEDSSLGLEPKH